MPKNHQASPLPLGGLGLTSALALQVPLAVAGAELQEDWGRRQVMPVWRERAPAHEQAQRLAHQAHCYHPLDSKKYET